MNTGVSKQTATVPAKEAAETGGTLGHATQMAQRFGSAVV